MSAAASFGGKPKNWELEELIAEARSIFDDLELGILDRSKPDGKRWSLSAFDLWARARIRSRDKLAQPDRGRGPLGSHGDPTWSQAADRVEDNDEDLKHWHALQMDLAVAMTYLRRLPATLDKATPAQQRPDKPELDSCRICGDGPIYRGRPEDASDRCRWCYDRWTEFGVDMPVRIIRWRKEGKRITSTMIRADLEELTR